MEGMTHPIIPSSELVQQWASEKCYDERDWLYEFHIATRAAQWGSDQELEACCEWLLIENSQPCSSGVMRAARRPKLPSLKEQALEALDRMDQFPTADDQHIIRRALEALPND
jgi:hypothetical protein